MVEYEPNAWLSEHLKIIERRILTRAQALAKEDSGGEKGVEPKHVAIAALEYAPGEPFPKRRWRDVFFESISGITVVAAILTLAFAAVGILVQNEHSERYFDVARLLAGAVVGSTGAGIVRRPA